MTVTVETLEKLERKITLTLPVVNVESEVQTRLKKIARTVKMDGFRPGKVPMNVVAQRYGYSVHYEVMNDKVGEAFANAANEAKLRVAGQPRITEKESSPDGEMTFDAVFEVYPDVKINDLSSAEVAKVSAEVTDAAIDKTIDILRKQRRTFSLRAHDAPAQTSDRLTVDFEGKIDGETFAGGKAEDFQFILGDGQMLKEFEDATQGMKAGESKTFQMVFPADYHGKDVAGKTADFMVTVKKIEAAHLPEVNAAMAKSLGIDDATVEGLRADVQKNLAREVKVRLLSRNKQAVMDALIASAELDLPTTAVQSEITRLMEGPRSPAVDTDCSSGRHLQSRRRDVSGRNSPLREWLALSCRILSNAIGNDRNSREHVCGEHAEERVRSWAYGRSARRPDAWFTLRDHGKGIWERIPRRDGVLSGDNTRVRSGVTE